MTSSMSVRAASRCCASDSNQLTVVHVATAVQRRARRASDLRHRHVRGTVRTLEQTPGVFPQRLRSPCTRTPTETRISSCSGKHRVSSSAQPGFPGARVCVRTLGEPPWLLAVDLRGERILQAVELETDFAEDGDVAGFGLGNPRDKAALFEWDFPRLPF